MEIANRDEQLPMIANRDMSLPHPERFNCASSPSRWKLITAGAAQPPFSSTVLYLLFLEKDQQGHPPKNTDSYRSCSGFSITADQQYHLVQLPHCTAQRPLPRIHPRGMENLPFLHHKRWFEKLRRGKACGAATDLAQEIFAVFQSPSRNHSYKGEQGLGVRMSRRALHQQTR